MRLLHSFALKRGFIIAALLASAIWDAQGADFSNLYIFGDSLSDSGTFGPIVGAGRYDRFTTKPGTVWAENLGASYGRSVTPAYTALPGAPLVFSLNATGNNLAIGGALINSAPSDPSAANLPPVSAQITGFLARGSIDSRALYTLWAGGNDVFAQFVASAGANPSVAHQAAIATAANDLTAQVTRLQAAGARNLVVIGLMDTASAPFGLSASASDRGQLKSLKATFNASLAAGLAGKNLLYFDTGGLINSILANPLAYGFTNTTAKACGNVSALLCQTPANGYMYADDKHPSTSFHKLVSDWIYASLEGASRVGVLSQVPIGRSGAQWRSIDGRFNEFQNFGYKGQGFFVTGDYASSQKDAYAGMPSADGSGGSLIMGYEKAWSEQLFAGVTAGYGNAPFDLGNNQGTVKYNEWALSAFVSQKIGALYVNGLATYSWLEYETRRNIILGPLNTSEQGHTSGRQFGAKGQIGYNFMLGPVIHGPLVGLAWERVNVDGFSEQSNSATAMAFGDQSRESLRSRLGWQIAAETSMAQIKLRPYAQLSYDYEHKKDERTYSAGFVGSNSAMDMRTANRTGGYGTLLAGISADLSKGMRLGIGVSATISQPGANSAAINVTLSAPF